MNNLTEQWNKGKLPEGDYYIKRRNSSTLYDNIDSHGVWRNSIDEDIIEVLAEVPSYEQWEKTEKRSWLVPEFDNEIDELNDTIEGLEKENVQLKKWCEEFNALEVAKENIKLKELLKECRDEIEYLRKHYKGNIDHFKNNTRLDKEINQALGEE